MKLHSLGYRTDLIFTRFDGETIDRGSYLVVKTHSNPNYFWGNLLVFDRAPKAGDFKKWKEIFKTEFTNPRIYHFTFAWDSPSGETGEISQFLNEEFHLEKSVVLTAESVHLPTKYHPEIQVEPIRQDQDWEKSIQIQIAGANDSLSKSQWEKFYRSQMDRYRKMVELERGVWFGAYLNLNLVACLGIFTESGLGRYQTVSTHPDYQRQGICGSLVYKSAQYAFEKMGVQTLVMVADVDYHAARIYESVGFRPSEKMVGVCWWDKTRA